MQEMAFPRPQIWTLSGGACPQTPPGSERLWRANVSPTCIFKISRYAADYRYFIAYKINAQGWKKKRILEGVGMGGGGGGGERCILKIVIAKGGGGGVKF